MQLGHVLRTKDHVSIVMLVAPSFEHHDRGLSEKHIQEQALEFPTAADTVRQGCTMLAIRGKALETRSHMSFN